MLMLCCVTVKPPSFSKGQTPPFPPQAPHFASCSLFWSIRFCRTENAASAQLVSVQMQTHTKPVSLHPQFPTLHPKFPIPHPKFPVLRPTFPTPQIKKIILQCPISRFQSNRSNIPISCFLSTHTKMSHFPSSTVHARACACAIKLPTLSESPLYISSPRRPHTGVLVSLQLPASVRAESRVRCRHELPPHAPRLVMNCHLVPLVSGDHR